MTFTFTADLSINRDYVRFEIGDTTADSAWLSDELIASLITKAGSANGAVIKGLQYIITQLSKPDFKADWLSVTNGEARKGYETMLADKKREYGVGGLTTGLVYTYRYDSTMEDLN